MSLVRGDHNKVKCGRDWGGEVEMYIENNNPRLRMRKKRVDILQGVYRPPASFF